MGFAQSQGSTADLAEHLAARLVEADQGCSLGTAHHAISTSAAHRSVMFHSELGLLKLSATNEMAPRFWLAESNRRTLAIREIADPPRGTGSTYGDLVHRIIVIHGLFSPDRAKTSSFLEWRETGRGADHLVQ